MLPKSGLRLSVVLIGAFLSVIVGWIAYRAFPPAELRLQAPFQHSEGNMWSLDLPRYSYISDSVGSNSSRLRLFENGVELGAPHSIHEDIKKIGLGKYSHWRERLLFSTSDNSDPNVNGKTYSIRLTSIWTERLVLMWLLTAVLVGVVSPLFSIVYAKSPRVIFLSGLIVAYQIASIYFLYANIVNVTQWHGRAIYGVKLLFDVAIISIALYIFGVLPDSGSLRRILTRALKYWFFLASIFLMVETSARVTPIASTTAINPGIKYFWPDWVNYPLNNFAHRDREFSTNKEPHTFRILLLGDSFTEGAGLSREQTFGRLLEASLNNYLAGRGKVEVYNLGHCGMNTVEEVGVLYRDGAALKPDMVILNYVFNDTETHPPQVEFNRVPAWATRANDFFLREIGSYAYYFFLTTTNPFPENFPGFYEFVASQQAPDSIGWRNMTGALGDYQHWLALKKADNLTLVWPWLSESFKTDPLANQIRNQVVSEFAGRKLNVIDLNSVLSKTAYRELTFSSYDPHPNAMANKAVAMYLYEHLIGTPSFQNFTRLVVGDRQ